MIPIRRKCAKVFVIALILPCKILFLFQILTYCTIAVSCFVSPIFLSLCWKRDIFSILRLILNNYPKKFKHIVVVARKLYAIQQKNSIFKNVLLVKIWFFDEERRILVRSLPKSVDIFRNRFMYIVSAIIFCHPSFGLSAGISLDEGAISENEKV